MLTVFVFIGLVALCCGYALHSGGAPERSAAAMIAGATAASALVELPDDVNFYDVEIATLIIDVALLAGLALLALRANRFWPLWMTGIHTSAVAAHVVRLINPTLLPAVYHVASAITSFPILALLVIGTLRHRERLRVLGNDPSWSSSFAE